MMCMCLQQQKSHYLALIDTFFFARCVVGYDGTQFSGFQSQPSGNTVQDAMERALFKLVGQRVVVYPAGRTDAGVSARAQVLFIDNIVELQTKKQIK